MKKQIEELLSEAQELHTRCKTLAEKQYYSGKADGLREVLAMLKIKSK